MTNLEVAIDQIHRWMRDNAPHREALLQPPLTRQQIDELVGTTGITLPEEAYTLYKWRNGVANGECLFPGYRFTPLEEAAEDLIRHWRDEFLRGPDTHAWLFVFQVYGTWGGYALFCDTKPRATSAVDYDGADAVTDTLADLAGMIADRFAEGSVVIDDQGELEFADCSARIGLDPDVCYRRVLEEDWEAMSQAVLRIGFHAAVQRRGELAIDNSLRMFRNPSSRIWQEPLILKDFMINLNFSTNSESQNMMAQLLQHQNHLLRWRAASLVGNSQYFHQYDWVRPLADHLAGELAQPVLPPPCRDDLILAFGKTGDARAVPLLKQMKQQRRDMTGVVAGMSLKRVYGISG